LNGGSTFPVAAVPTALAATPSGSFLYVGGQSGAIYVYTINADGSLVKANNGAAVATGFSPVSIAIDSTGTWLFSVDSNSTTLFEYQINSTTGVLTAGNPAAIALDQPGSPFQVYITPNNQLLYIPLQTGGVDIFTFNSTTGAIGNRQLLKPITSPNADFAALADPKTQFLFVAETGLNGVRVFSVGTNGALTELAGSPYTTGLGPTALSMDSTGAYLYVANKGANNISGFSLGVNGGLTILPTSPFTAGTTPYAMTLDQTGKYLAVISAGGNPDLQVFSFDATTGGKLDPVAHATTGTDPVNAIAIVSAK
jgi:6-phosphogluconolactonase (cycloisomerase 2 family)